MEFRLEEDNPDILVVSNVLTQTGVTATRRLRRVGGPGSSQQRRHSVL